MDSSDPVQARKTGCLERVWVTGGSVALFAPPSPPPAEDDGRVSRPTKARGVGERRIEETQAKPADFSRLEHSAQVHALVWRQSREALRVHPQPQPRPPMISGSFRLGRDALDQPFITERRRVSSTLLECTFCQAVVSAHSCVLCDAPGEKCRLWAFRRSVSGPSQSFLCTACVSSFLLLDPCACSLFAGMVGHTAPQTVPVGERRCHWR